MGSVQPIYICYGNEKQRINHFIDQEFQQLGVPDNLKEFALTRYDLHETPLDVVLDDIETFPFYISKKLVVATNATFLTGKDRAKVDHNIERFIRYAESPVDYTTVILTVFADKLDERKKVVKLLKSRYGLQKFTNLQSVELRKWIEDKVRSAGCSISQRAIDRLLFLAGTELQHLSNEIEKCLLYAGQTGEITEDIVNLLASGNTEHTVFQLIDEIAAVRIENALNMLADLLNRREEPVKIVLLLARQFRLMLQAKHLHQKGYSPQQISSQLKQAPFVIRLVLGQARMFSANTIAHILAELAELDYQMKTGKVDKVVALELFLMGLAKSFRARGAR